MTTHTAVAGTLGSRIETLTENWRAALERRRVFKATLNELSALSNRELTDLGLNRSELRGIAWQAANDR